MIWVSPLSHCPDMLVRHDPSHVLTLLAPADTMSLELEGRSHLLLQFNDIDADRPGLIAPTPADVARILSFSHLWDGRAPLLINCWAGISRSSAAAYIIACDRNPGRENDIAVELRRRAPFSTPNRLMIALADDLLGRQRRMIEAVSSIGRGAEAFEGAPYELPLRWPLG